ncbi:PX-domain-containing protein [Mycena sanguinolenta]|uniref:PX-domain-containing protein n=1 Tax=Mycena sanguinolenta TaxID=230812 RepID=A0A8H6Y9Z8_9AGAR|nr:PX-domain-containing protein [Mycena sanguinolenta]
MENHDDTPQPTLPPIQTNHRPRRPTRTTPSPPLAKDDPPPAESEPLASSPVAETSSSIDLTPLRAHYLKKALIQLQFNHELDEITSPLPNNVSSLSYLGPPFSPPPKGAPLLDLPFLRYMFRQFVLTFPFMAAAPKDFYSDKLQPFMASVLARNISPTSVFDDGSEGAEQALRLRLLAKAERNLSLFVGAATKLAEKEEVVRLTQIDLDRLESAARKRQAKNLEAAKDIFEVNIVSVRTVVDKGRVRSRAHEEFIVRTRRSNFPDVFVSRRYGDFRALALELRKAHPMEDIRPPPVKDRTTVSAPSASSPLSPAPSFASRQQAMWDDPDQTPPIQQISRLAREKNRLTLRAYLHSLLASYTIASSPVLKSFLLSGPTTLRGEEVEDALRREEADRVRDDGRKHFAKEIASRVDGLRDAVKSVKGDIMGKDGLTQIFATVKVTPNVRDLPSNYKAVLEWARMSLASTVFQQFVASDNASETFASLKRIHGLMPYFMLKAALRISNPIAMIRSVLDLFLVQPFGGRSLLQRMFTGSLTEEVRALEEEIEAVKEKVEDPMICEKIRQFVYAPREIQDMLKADAVAERMNLITVVLRAADEPFLSRAQMHRVAKAHRAHAIYMAHRESLADSDDDDGPKDDDAWLFEDLKVLANLYSRLRDREQLIGLIFEGSTSELLKDMITIFYTPLAQVYRAASIADSLSDLQSFINDLIKTVEQSEDLEDPRRTVQAFIDLIERHEQAFYNFVHKVHSKGEGLFDSLMRWIELFLTVVREGLGEPISLEFLLPHTGQERQVILEEVDKIALYHYKLKVIYEDKLRRRFGRVQASVAQNDADAEDEATKALVDGVAEEITFGELIQGDAVDLAAEETDEDSDEESSDLESSGSEESDSEEDESTEESEEDSQTPKPTPKQVPRPKPPPIKPPHAPHRHATQRAQHSPHHRTDGTTTPTQSRKRSLSLKTSRSMTFIKEQLSLGRHGHESPVPPLPKSLVAAMSKPLPPSPSPGSSSEQFAPPTPSRPPPPKPKTRKRRAETIKPPDLQHIPRLLPIFKEMMRTHLLPRQRTN